mmetsp:Transcript_1689/g.2005  ORF Transcript_1689/g.2005 Transcript_1689/m.2005 type:complete len:269 (-) Transcript_1689:31-837(-)
MCCVLSTNAKSVWGWLGVVFVVFSVVENAVFGEISSTVETVGGSIAGMEALLQHALWRRSLTDSRPVDGGRHGGFVRTVTNVEIVDEDATPDSERVRNRQARKYTRGEGTEHFVDAVNSNDGWTVNVVKNDTMSDAVVIQLSDNFVNGASEVQVRDVKKWFDKYSSPRKLPPAAWCSREVMSVAVPTNARNRTKNFERAGWASWNARRSIRSDGEESSVGSAVDDASCGGKLVLEFFETESGRVDAWTGDVDFDTCGGGSGETAGVGY